MLKKGLRRREREAGVAKGAQSAPPPPLPAFLTRTARRRKCVQQRKCGGDGTSLVFLHPLEVLHNHSAWNHRRRNIWTLD